MKSIKNRIVVMFDRKERGFTIIEILIALPIVVLLSLTLATTVFNQYGELQKSTARARLRIEGEITLLSLEDELLFATDFGQVKSSDLIDNNAPTGGWTYNSTPTDTLIVYETALTADRRDPDREFVYKKGSSCGTSFNIAVNNIIYYTTANTGNSYRTLYRRTLAPQYVTCGTNYKTQTCPSSNMASPCVGADAKLSDKVVDFQVEYFDENNVATSNPLNGVLVKLTLTLSEKIYGENVNVPTSISMKRVN